ncbi:MAG: hypothetical protein A3F78_22165 [Burkholderiales bacterium RIFCSPLOWO2_12_FULL_61_40]|nr:MAG: hypothetical protein A3F78_22165 [Burkholderiales bacterium RIFCSPLOWO2_12_FULL_61_40]
MRRIQFFEFEDQHWLPASIRNGITDFLQFSVEYGDLYKGFANRLSKALDRSGDTQIIDLCSGAGGPMKSLLKHIPDVNSGRIKVHLTDYYPNLPALSELARTVPICFTYSKDAISALDVPSSMAGFRTLFSSFHHFNERDATRILQDAVAKKRGIAIAELTQRHALLLVYMFFTPFLVLFASPFQKPFRWSRLFWTYVLPVIPLVVAFDGFVSCLRTYTPEELMKMVHGIAGYEDYEWQAGVEWIGVLPIGVTYLIGLPRKAT